MSKELLSINVNDKTERKGQLTYLSWAWAWAEVLKFDPAAEWEPVEYPQPDGTLSPCMWIGDTAMVKTKVTINGKTRTCQLPVMDNKNNAVKNPDARKISDAIMRCMTKAISMHGLGLYIYAGEDLPEVIETPEQAAANEATDDRVTPRQAELDEFAAYLIECHESGKDLPAIEAWYQPKNWSADNATEQDERTYVWGLLKPYSKLRSTIKANSPHKAAA